MKVVNTTTSVATKCFIFSHGSYVAFFLILFEDGNMEEWDQETLEKVVESKKNEYNQNKPTDIVSAFFLISPFVSETLGCVNLFYCD